MNFQRTILRLLSAGNLSNSIIAGVSRRPRDAIFTKLITNRRSKFSENEFPTTTAVATMAILGFIKRKDDDDDVKVTSQEILLAKADALFDQSEYKETYELLNKYKDVKNVEILWRLSKALYNMSKTASEVESRRLVNEGYEFALAALAIDQNHYAVHKWMAVLLDAKSNSEGIKARIKELYAVKDHMLRSSELNPKDATTLYMLGSWCFEISNLAWYQRKIASAIFGTPPTSSFEEALGYFEAAERVEPNFYSRNLLMLGKTYLKLNRNEEAFKYLKLAADYQAKNDEDQESKKEALKLLKEINV